MALRGLTAVGLVAGLMGGFAASAHAAEADPERTLNSAVTTRVVTDVTSAELNAILNSEGKRVTDIETHALGTRVDAVLVDNYSSALDAFGRSGSEVRTDEVFGDLIADAGADDKRIIEIDRYSVGIGDTRFRAVMIDDDGDASKPWAAASGLTPAGIAAFLGADSRPIDIEPLGSGEYAVVAIANTGVGQSDYKLHYAQTEAELRAGLSQDGHRPIDVERDGGAWTAISVPEASTPWAWFPVLSEAELQGVATNGARVYDLERSGESFSALVFDPNQPLSGLSARAEQAGSGWGTAPHGFYYRGLGAGGQVYAANHERLMFDPASAIKFLVAVYAMRQVELGNASLSDPVPWGGAPNCAPPQTTSLEDAIAAMMKVSDNNATIGLIDHFGSAQIHGFAEAAGFPDTVITGCVNGVREWTLDEASRFYEAASNGTLISAESWEKLITLMNAGKLLGVSPQQLQAVAVEVGRGGHTNAFTAAARIVFKGGSFDGCPPAPAACSPSIVVNRTLAGVAYIPYWENGQIVTRPLFFGVFLDVASLACPFRTAMQPEAEYIAGVCPAYGPVTTAGAAVNREVMTEIYRDALLTFPAAPGAGDDVAPQTTIKGKYRRKHTVFAVKLRSNEPGATFRCKWKRTKAKYKPCKRKFKLRGLKPELYELRAIATDTAMNADPTPARKPFRIEPR